MAEIVGPRGTSYVRLAVCTRCWLVVPPDRDQCPNPNALVGEQHPIRVYVPEDQHAERFEVAQKNIARSSIAAAEAALDIVKAALA